MKRLKTNRKAISTVVTTIIITAVIISMVVSVSFYYLNLRTRQLSTNEYESMKSFMKTFASHVDKAAWNPGLTRTLSHANQYGLFEGVNNVLEYSIYVDAGAGWNLIGNFYTGLWQYKISTSYYGAGNDYFSLLSPFSMKFMREGVNEATSVVWERELHPMSDGSYLRILAAPTIRVYNYTIAAGETHYYYRVMIPLMNYMGSFTINRVGITGVKYSLNSTTTGVGIRAVVTFPNVNYGSSLFHFEQTSYDISTPSGSIVEIFIGEVNIYG
jgi:hypothetical protein